MSDNPKKYRASEKKVPQNIEQNPMERITHQLVRQLKPYLPIESLEKITKELDEIVVENHRLPIKMFAHHISNDLFPIKTTEDLEKKLSAGVRRAVSLALSGSVVVRNESFTKILSTTFQEPKGNLSRLRPVRKVRRPTRASKSKTGKGGI